MRSATIRFVLAFGVFLAWLGYLLASGSFDGSSGGACMSRSFWFRASM